MTPLDPKLAPSLADARTALARWGDPGRHAIGAALTERDGLRALLLECRIAMYEDNPNPSRRMVAAMAMIDWVLAGD